MFQHPVVVSPKQRQQSLAGAIPPPPSMYTEHFPSGLSSSEHNQINNKAFFSPGKLEYLLVSANDLIVDCVSMSEYLPKLPSRVACRREEGRKTVEKERLKNN